MFMIIFSLYVLLTKVDNETLQLNEGVQKVLNLSLPQQFSRGPTNIETVDTLGGVFNWLGYVLYPVLCVENGAQHWGHLNFYNRVMYGVRLRQIRVKSKTCSMHVGGLDRQTLYEMDCYQSYGTDVEATETLVVNNTSYPWYSSADLGNEILSSWSTPTPSLKAAYSENIYPGSGYIHNFQLTEANCGAPVAGGSVQDEILALRDSGWVDDNTRALVIEFSTYNPNFGKILTVSILCERTLSGHTKCNPRTNVYRMFMFEWNAGESRVVLTALLRLCVCRSMP